MARPAEDRFRSCLHPRENGCLDYVGPRSNRPWWYGMIKVDGKSTPTHRYAWMLANGPIPDGLFVCHKCDRPPCCNPDHLFLGTSADNMRDMAAKGRGRGPRGVAQPLHKLTEDNVREIRRRYQRKYRGPNTYSALGAEFGVDPSIIGDVVHRRTWVDVD